MSNTAAMKDRLAELEAENARLKEQTERKIRFKVSEKGCLSMYGLGRFPISLYSEQWEAVLNNAAQIREQLRVNAGTLKRKE